MKLNTAIKEFMEKYDSEAMASIDNIATKVGPLVATKPLVVFNLKESCDQFTEYLRGYAQYMKANKDNPKRTSREGIHASVNKFMEETLFKESKIQYKDIPAFVKSYLESVKAMEDEVTHLKEDMELNDVSLEEVGDLSEYADIFIGKLNESLSPIMENILWASGYAGSHGYKTPLQTQLASAHKVSFL